MSKIKRAIVLPDVHVPVEDKATLAAVEAYMGEHEWDYAIQLGDFLNLDCISRHTKNDPVAQTAKTVEDEFEAANRVLTRWDIALGKAKKYLLEGNHEFRTKAYAKEHPQVRGLMDVPKGLELADRGWTWMPFWTNKSLLLSVGKANFIHGLSIAKNHPKVNYEAYQVNLFTGHTHDVALHSPILWGHDNTPVCQSCGCLCQYDQAYLEGNPTKWQHAFAEFWFRPDGFFHYDIVRIFKHAFVRNGKLYDGRAILKGRR